MQNKVDILGTEYTIKTANYEDNAYFKKNSFDGYCDSTLHEVFVCNMKTYPGFEDETEEYCKTVEKGILRHELAHAFLNESGLQDSANRSNGSWSKNEEMIDWIAIQFPKMYKVYEQLGIL